MSRMPLRWLSMRLERLLGLRRLRRLLLVLGPLCLVLEPTVIFPVKEQGLYAQPHLTPDIRSRLRQQSRPGTAAGHSSVQRTGSGSLAMLLAIRRASSRASNLTPARFDRAHSR